MKALKEEAGKFDLQPQNTRSEGDVHVVAADVVGIAIMSDEYTLLERINWRGTSPQNVFPIPIILGRDGWLTEATSLLSLLY
jgi:hypothetical protein